MPAAAQTGLGEVRGTVQDASKAVIPNAKVTLTNTANGVSVTRMTTGDGNYEFVTVKPGRVPAPNGGLQAPHIEVSVFARGLLKRLVTRIYFPDEPEANEADPVLALVEPERRDSLVAVDEGDALRFDIRLQGDGETPFFDV